MAVLGRLLISSAERLDLPDILSMDSYNAGDWKYFLKGLVGDSKPYILKGFEIIDPQSAIGTQSCSIKVADSVVFYPGSNSGAFFHGLQEGHALATPLVPELRKNAVNYVYLTFSTLNTSIDTRAFWDPDKDGGVGGEFTQDINTESVLKVEVNVSTGSFPANTIPIAKVTVGPLVITAIQDARDMLFRLGTGGISPNPYNTFSFRSLPSSSYQRIEPPTVMSAPSDPNPFQGADKNIWTLKEWMDVVMTKLAELGGTDFWYENAATYSLINNFIDSLATTFKSKGQWSHSSATPGLITWSEDLQIKITQDPRTYIVRNGNKTLTDEQVAYLALVRDQVLNASDAEVSWTNGQSYINTIGGAIGLFANLAKGDWIKKVNDPHNLYLRVEEFYDSVNLGGGTTTAANAKSVRLSSTYQGTTGNDRGRYDKGVYAAADVTVSDRNASALQTAGGNFHWIAVRSDTIENIGAISTVTLSGTILSADGIRARVSETSHGLVDGDQITVTVPVAQAGVYTVDVEDADTYSFLTTNTTTGALTAYYGTVTTAARSTAYGLQLESANHNFASGDKIIIAGTTSYNGSYVVNKRNATQFTFPIGSALGSEATGTATLARVNIRSEQGVIKIIQGETVNIGDSVADNLKQFVGMTSFNQTVPTYATSSSYNTLQGSANYNANISDNLTDRVSKLTAMMADKAQDKTIKYALYGAKYIVNTTNGANQEITFTPAASTLTITQPGSPGNAVISLSNVSPGISLGTYQVAYVTLNRNSATTPSVTVVNATDLPIGENTFIVAARLGTSSVYLWDGTQIDTGTTPTPVWLRTILTQNSMMKLVDGGTWSWNLGTQTLAWSSTAYVQLPALTDTTNSITSGSIVLQANEVLYATLNRTTPGGSLALSVTNISALSPTVNTFIIARRINNDVIVGDSMKLVDGQASQLYGVSNSIKTFTGMGSDSDTTPSYSTPVAHTTRFVADGTSLETAISRFDEQLDKMFGQFRLQPKVGSPTRATITGVDYTLLDSAVLSQELSNLFVQFTGAEIDFQTGNVYASDGVTALGINFTPFSIGASNYFWYSVTAVASIVSADNRITLQLIVNPASADNAVAGSAPYPAFVSGKKIGAVLVQNVAGTHTVSQVRQLGTGSSGGDGTGDLTEILSRIEGKLLDSTYELATPCVFKTDKQTMIASATATYDVANTYYKFTAGSQNILSIQLLDANEYLTTFAYPKEVDVDLFWDLVGGVDTAATVQLSRDGGTTLQTVTMTRTGLTDHFTGTLKFADTETTGTLESYDVSNADTTVDLNATTHTELSQAFTVASNQVVKQVTAYMYKTGSPTGNVYLRIVKDNAGSPSTAAADIVAISSSLDVSTLTASVNLVQNFTFDAPLIPGTYHLVFASDVTYKANTAGNYLSIRADSSSAPVPLGKQWDGASWTTVTNTKFVYLLSGWTLDLRLKVTSSAGSKVLKGFGVFYDKVAGAITAGIDALEVVRFQDTNQSTFTLTKFLPDPKFLKVYCVETGQVFAYGAFTLAGHSVIFPSNSFNASGQVYTLRFDQMQGSGFDNTDSNSALLAANFLGSTDPTIDRSSAGRGIMLRRPDGTLREITIDNSDNIVIYSV